MKKFIPLFFAFLLLSGCLKTYDNSVYNPIIKICSNTKKGIVRGTGFIISYKKNFFLITAAHVVAGSELMWLFNKNETNSKIIPKQYFSPYADDIAIVIISDVPRQIKPMKLYKGKVKTGILCEAYGYKYGFDYVVAGGLLLNSGFTVNGKVKNHLLTSCEIFTGMSGGPLVYNGQVIGVNSQILYCKGKDLQYGVHVPVKELINWFDSMLIFRKGLNKF